MNYLFILLSLVLFNICYGSIGNESPFFLQCTFECSYDNCTQDGSQFLNKDAHSVHLKLLQWTCENECDYSCMWKTVDYFREYNYMIPQFYGKVWPFIRILGIQEPASTVFSLMNLYVNVKMLIKFHKETRTGSPLAWMWYIYGFVCCHTWLWSAIFHARDLYFTEFMDYSSAFSMVVISCYSATIRILRTVSPLILIVVTVFFLSFLSNHVMYLYTGSIDYGYNMKVNIIVGFYTVMCWILWSIWNRKKMPYVWKVALYVTLVSITTLLEIVDVPPIFWIFDFHALWHLSTVPHGYLFYSFVIDDSKYLRKLKFQEEKLSLGH